MAHETPTQIAKVHTNSESMKLLISAIPALAFGFCNDVDDGFSIGNNWWTGSEHHYEVSNVRNVGV